MSTEKALDPTSTQRAGETLESLTGTPGAALANWRAVREKIHDEFDRAASDEHRAALLAMFKRTMDLVESAVAGEDREGFRQARQRDYNLLIVKECRIGENVCVDTADAVTRREVAAGRMSADHELRTMAVGGMAAPHFTRAELLEQQRQKNLPELAGREDLAEIRLARRRDYERVIVRDDLLRGNVGAEAADVETHREVVTGRMSADHQSGKMTVGGMTAPHLTRAETLERPTNSPKPAGGVARFFGWLRGR